MQRQYPISFRKGRNAKRKLAHIREAVNEVDDNRPVLNTLISDIIGGGIRKLYCECEDRLSRSVWGRRQARGVLQDLHRKPHCED